MLEEGKPLVDGAVPSRPQPDGWPRNVPEGRTSLPWEFRELALVAGFQAVIIVACRWLGLSAISDDDYARIVIAQQFAEAPSLDPSGTSWLPFPFLFSGSLLLVFGASLDSALSSAHLLSLAAACCIYLAARNMGCARKGALLATALASLIPTAASLSATFVPGYFTAAMLVYGSSTLMRPRQLIWGALCLFLASASRYEAWAPAACFSLVCAGRARKLEGRERLETSLGAFLAAAFPVTWMLHGALSHGDALFFVARVVDYKAALGSVEESLLERLFNFPKLVLLAEPEIFWTGTLALLTVWGSDRLALRSAPADWNRLPQARVPWPTVLVVLSVLAFLMIGAIRGGTPTHHSERPLLSLWILLATGLGWALERGFTDKVLAPRLLVACLLGAFFALITRGTGSWQREPFAQRKAEEELGFYVRDHLAKDPVALALPDYGYFAVMAAGQRPSRFIVLDKNDPRDQNTEKDHLILWLQDEKNCFFVTRRDHPSVVPHVLAISGHAMVARNQRCTTAESRP